MSAAQAYAFVAFAIVAAITPGPSNVMLAATGANAGIRGGLPCLFGVGMGMALMMFAVALGMGALVIAQPALIAAMKWGGGAYLLWLSWRIAMADASPAPGTRRPIGFAEAALFQWVNPKSWLVATSAAATYLQPQSGTAFAQPLLLGGLFLAAALPACFVWLAFGVALQRGLNSPGRLRTFNLAMGALLAGSVAFILAVPASAG